MTLLCPVCGGRELGRVGHDQYYCWNCCVEFVVRKNNVRVYQVMDDGTLVGMDEQLQRGAATEPVEASI